MAHPINLKRLFDRARLGVSLLTAIVPSISQAQGLSPEKTYQRVNAMDLMGGYIAEGVGAEVAGFIGAKDGAVMFKYAPMSAQYPLTVVTMSLPRDLLERIASQCAWDGTAVGMCKATVRGTVMSKASHSIVADGIMLE